MQISLAGKTALITGASNGLGRAMAERFAASGARVAMMAREPERLAAAAAEIAAKTGGQTLALPCDITDPAAREAALAELAAKWGAVDILVNNAGSSQRGPIEAAQREDILADLDLKLMAAIALIQAVVPHMKAQNSGRILNVTAIIGKAPDGGSVPTSLSRAAGLALTRALSKELAPWNILVNSLCVGKIKSGQWERRYEAEGKPKGLSYDEFLAPTAKSIPLGRLGEAEEFANAACFLVSDAASYITGAAINVDGGLCPVA